MSDNEWADSHDKKDVMDKPTVSLLCLQCC